MQNYTNHIYKYISKMAEDFSKMINILSFLNSLFLNLFINLEYCYRENKTMLNIKLKTKL
ncbi:hypothetical protein SAMN05880573_10523 [Chryseobacterium sp. RU33C]|nr:hypothetical protein SAMN05880573_10523 [Chryseobacterium sp. RU33C]